VRDEERRVNRKKPARKKDGAKKNSRWGFRGMTVRNWLELLVVPLVLVGIGLALDLRQQGLEDQRADRERELAEQRAQDEALQAYFDQMSTLLLEKDLRNFEESEEGKEARTLARARTLTVLTRLDPSRKTQLMRFLQEATLVERVDEGIPIMALNGADLSGANLSYGHLTGASLGGADLRGTNLSGALMHEADLTDADLSGADLSGADLSGANLLSAKLIDDADLSGANLSGANLTLANLSGATGWTEEQLTAALSLEGATMPNGQKYEDWLKSKGSGEDGENE
jgi:uncharacterized protein YjbI with pentapeptide repeats